MAALQHSQWQFDTPGDRLAVTTFVALMCHVAVVFGVGFDFDKPGQRLSPTLEVILVQTTTDTPVDNPDFLAQANHDGGGNAEDALRPSAPLPAPFPDLAPTIVSSAALPKLAAAETPPVVEQITTAQEQEFRAAPEVFHEPVENPGETAGSDAQTVPLTDNVAAETPINAANTLASLQAELNKKLEEFAKRPRHTFISARTRESRYATYMDGWRTRIERIGTMNYPEDVRREGISGKLIVDVAINADGTVHEIKIQSPSDHPVLDDAAVQIVRQAMPFAPFPDEIRQDTDVLHITRTWQFSTEGELMTTLHN
jgi:protein TonB